MVPADDDIDMLMKGHIRRNVSENERRVDDQQLAWVDQLSADNRVDKKFNWTFVRSGDSREPEMAGILGAALGSFFTLVVTLLLSFPIGVAAAVYLEELAPKNRWTDLIEVNINNLAAVPSIVFGLLGLAVFLNFFGLPRSTPLVGGLVLTLMTLPTIIIASRAALQSVPPSIREAALGIGVSKMQMIVHHVLPLALPGILTGTIIGMARALGETAPLLMIGMVAFIVDIPPGFQRSVDRPSRSNLLMGRQSRAGLCGKDLGGHYGSAGISNHHECGGGHASQKVRTKVVSRAFPPAPSAMVGFNSRRSPEPNPPGITGGSETSVLIFF